MGTRTEETGTFKLHRSGVVHDGCCGSSGVDMVVNTDLMRHLSSKGEELTEMSLKNMRLEMLLIQCDRVLSELQNEKTEPIIEPLRLEIDKILTRERNGKEKAERASEQEFKKNPIGSVLAAFSVGANLAGASLSSRVVRNPRGRSRRAMGPCQDETGKTETSGNAKRGDPGRGSSDEVRPGLL